MKTRAHRTPYLLSRPSINTNANSGTAALGTVTITASSPGIHTLNIKYVSGASEDVFIESIVAFNSQIPTVNIINAGLPGAASNSWTATGGFNPGAVVTSFSQDVTFIDQYLNDCTFSSTISNYTTNIQSLITNALTANSGNTDVILMTSNPGNQSCTTAGETAQQFVTALRSLAIANNLCLIDTYDRWISWSNANAAG